MSDSSPQAPSMAQQVGSWLLLTSIVVGVLVMGAWWLATDLPITTSTTFIFLFAAMGLSTTVHQLLILGIRRMVRGRIERRTTGRDAPPS